MNIRQDDPAAPHVSGLLAFHLEELRGVMGEHAFALDASGLSSPDVTFWTAWREDELAGFAALKHLGAGLGEVKSMRAAPSARGSGVGRALMDHVIAEARQRGYRELYLETGTAPLHEPAIGLYRRSGFVNCAAFADYQPSPHNQFMVLAL
ncbi:GNAT family N-acetyltransferase [Novosphingobium beihaiensis]|uniref:GNAT family N-acetyltransferase n=1 Tax=Novosphingobium beihaiensis TaxID=2930389 RepID=A0ABT0BTV2_9SPHN|nr:GNAT family N-acetyltransferase [Novosphingobium beihaiensis]MCJ2188487.1 GNAT family N-acetyltransferase [Novosphingobium beihaiensis]